MFPNGTCLGVNPGATVRNASGKAVTVNAFSVSELGFGTIDGFTFANDGVVFLSGASTRMEAGTIPGTLQNCTGNTRGWRVVYNGILDPLVTVRMTSGGMDVFRPGTVMMFR